MGPYVLSLVGAVAIVIAIFVQRASVPHMDRIIRVGGYTVRQVRLTSKQVGRGRLPQDPGFHQLAITLAHQLVRNLPYTRRYAPLQFFGVALFVTFGYLTPATIVTTAIIQLFCLLQGLGTLTNMSRSLRGARNVLRVTAPER